MKLLIQLAIVAAAACLAGCAASSVKHTWKSPGYQGGPVQKIAVIAVDERGMVRKGFENRFVRDLDQRGQPGVVTHELLGLPEIKADKAAAAAAFRKAGADSVLIVRLVDQTSYTRIVEARPEAYVPVTTGFGDAAGGYYGYGWYEYYSVAFTDMGASWANTKQKIYLDTSLYELAGGRRLWSTLTLTTLKEDSDRLAEVDTLTAKVVAALQKDGMTR